MSAGTEPGLQVDSSAASHVFVREDGEMTSRELSGEYWFCMKHRRVERYAETDSANRIGPFDTADEAARALDIIHEREKAYDAEDLEWDEGK